MILNLLAAMANADFLHTLFIISLAAGIFLNGLGLAMRMARMAPRWWIANVLGLAVIVWGLLVFCGILSAPHPN